MPSVKTNNVGASAIDRAVRLYGFEPRKQFPTIKGYRNETHPVQLADGSSVNLIIYKSEPDIVRTINHANEVSAFLAARGFPVRHSLDSRILRFSSGGATRYAALYNFLPGHTIAWEAYTQKHLKLLGKTTSDMHTALRDFDASDLPNVADVYLEIFARMQHYFAEPDVKLALAKKLNLAPPNLDTCVAALEACKRLPDQQALHMDFVRSNLLFSDDSGELVISGILDFEKTASGHRLFDIARTLAFLLVDCKYKHPEKVRKYFLHSGYTKRGTLDFHNVTIKVNQAEINLLENLIDVFLLYDFYKFFRHNPYESLPKNEHFFRTRTLLLLRNKI